jgi:outer membrane immunogenic protein
MRRPSLSLKCPGLLVGLVVAASFVATAASAADMPVPAPAAPPPAYHPPVYDWSGIYIGGSVGGGWINDTVTTTAATALQPAGTTTNVSAMGVLGGAQVGGNVQFAPVVVGLEGTWFATNLSGTKQIPAIPGGLLSLFQQSTSSAPYLATMAGRIGYAANDMLFYVKGGGAWMRVSYTQSVTAAQLAGCGNCPGGVVSQQALTDTRTGFVAGGGFEYGLNENLSIRVEYDYLGFGTKNYTFARLGTTTVTAAGVPPVFTVNAPVGLSLPVSIKSQLQMATVGVNYRFTWW